MSQNLKPSPGLRGRVYAATSAVWRLAIAAFFSLRQGAWLGLMDNRHLNGLSTHFYTGRKQWRDDAHNASGLFPWEERVVREYFPPAGTLLVGASGGGREAAALAKRGYQVDAFDCVPALVDYSRAWLKQQGGEVRIFSAGPGQIPEGLGRYAGVIVGWGGYMHIPGHSNRIAFLKALRACVDSGAPILLSFFARHGPSRRLDLIHRIARILRAIRFSRDQVEYGDMLDGTFDHWFTRDEVAGEMAAAGFELALYEEAPYGHAVGRAAPEGPGGMAGQE
ncbi:MAG: hypothetical protein FD180_3623 [Planctomycetota bacterium]|nr:MAG: hypothetical protein FD180_3623 [Planctomycetota bacterium]